MTTVLNMMALRYNQTNLQEVKNIRKLMSVQIKKIKEKGIFMLVFIGYRLTKRIVF